MFRDLVSALVFERERTIRRPDVAIGLCFLTEQGFQIHDIADMFGCCRRTAKLSHLFTIIPLLLIQEITTLFPHCSEKSMTSRLRSCGIRVQRQRVRDSLQRTDPSCMRSHCRNVLHKRLRYGILIDTKN